jgi:endoglucanase
MTSGGRTRLGAVVLVAAVLGGAGARAGLRDDERAARVERAAVPPPSPVDVAAARFLDMYVDPDGRVVRRDEGGDTVSEGQAYGLLIAAATADRARFDRVWGWTVGHLQRPDGLLSWRWADGAVVDGEPAGDADLDAAWALAIAARRWPLGGYGDQATYLAGAIAAHETAQVGRDGRVLAPGPWAVSESSGGGGVVVNPSYASPVAETVLAQDGHTDPNLALARTVGARSVIAQLIDQRGSPTDWARVAPDGRASGVDGPGKGGAGRFGWDAVRVPLRHAASCDPADRTIAGRVWPVMEAGAGVERLGDHPARLVGAAAAAGAAGDQGRVVELLDRASASEQERPTYYGSALTALARILLTTDRLGGCPLPAG